MGYPGTSSPTITGIDTVVDNIHDTDLPAVKTVVDAIEVHVHSTETKVDTIDTILDDLHGTDIPDLHTDIADVHTDVGTAITNIGTVDTVADGIALNRCRILQTTTTAAANSGAATVGTITSNVLIEDVIVRMVTYHADLTSITITGAAGVIDFIDAAEGAGANFTVADKQVAWSGAVELADGKTIVATFAGTSTGSVSIVTTIRYRPCTLTGAIA